MLFAGEKRSKSPWGWLVAPRKKRSDCMPLIKAPEYGKNKDAPQVLRCVKVLVST